MLVLGAENILASEDTRESNGELILPFRGHSVVGAKRFRSESFENICDNAGPSLKYQRLCFGSGGWCDKPSLSLARASPSTITVPKSAMMIENLKRFFGAEDATFRSSHRMLAEIMIKERLDVLLL